MTYWIIGSWLIFNLVIALLMIRRGNHRQAQERMDNVVPFRRTI